MKRLQECYPKAEKTVLCRPAYFSLFDSAPYGFRGLCFSRSDSKSLKEVLQSGPYDLAFVLGDNRYSWLARAAGSRWIVGFADDSPPWKNWMIDESVSINRPSAWADLAASLVDGVGPAPYHKAEWPVGATTKALPRLKKPYAVCHLGASSPLKHWPVNHWSVIFDSLHRRGLEIVLSVGPGEAGLLRPFFDRGYISLPGGPDLSAMTAVLREAAVLVAPDSGIAHLGRLIGVPTVAIFGPGNPNIHGAGRFWSNAPYRAVWKPDFGCRDQAILFRRKIDWARRCGRSFSQCETPGACMAAVFPDQIQGAIEDLLGVAPISGAARG